MSEYNIYKMQKKLKKYIDEERYWHTMGVMYTAASLAMCHGASIEKAQVAGLLHDCAKCIPNHKKLKLCKQPGSLSGKGKIPCNRQRDFVSHCLPYYRQSGYDAVGEDSFPCGLY